MADTPSRPKGLGRGLSALMADLSLAGTGGTNETLGADQRVPIDALKPHPGQPRRHFDAGAMAELVDSIREKGVIQPLIVRPAQGEPGRFEIAAGERRWRAAQAAGLDDVPVVVRDYDNQEFYEIAVIENVQRADLNAIDEGAAYRTLMERFGHTQQHVAQVLGKSRSHVANQMRLLELPVDVQEMVTDGRLSAGHVRPLIGHPDAAALARRIAERRLSARDAERLAKVPGAAQVARRSRVPKDADTRAIEGQLSAALGMAVRIDHSGPGEGRMTISFQSLEQLDDLLGRLSGD